MCQSAEADSTIRRRHPDCDQRSDRPLISTRRFGARQAITSALLPGSHCTTGSALPRPSECITDRIGTDEYNLNLSQERAEAVSNYLVEQGVPASVMHSEGRGKADPVVQCEPGSSADVIACLAPNRRVEISGLSER